MPAAPLADARHAGPPADEAGPSARPVSKRERSLLIVASLAAHAPRAPWLYAIVERAAVAAGRALLGRSYARVTILRGSDATRARFLEALDALGAGETRAVDVLLHLHGREGVLLFADGPAATRELAAAIAAQSAHPAHPARGKLRLLVSTACYGASHAADFIAAGFRAASGARGTNANAVHDHPCQLVLWAWSRPYRAALAWGNARLARVVCDALARRLGFEEVDSLKILRGRGDVAISRDPE